MLIPKQFSGSPTGKQKTRASRLGDARFLLLANVSLRYSHADLAAENNPFTVKHSGQYKNSDSGIDKIAYYSGNDIYSLELKGEEPIIH